MIGVQVTRWRVATWAVLGLAALSASCDGNTGRTATASAAPDRSREVPMATAPRVESHPPATPIVDLGELRMPGAERVIAVGDLHGDLAATRRVLRLAGVIDGNDRWSGGRTVLVQTGDQLDRGDDERAILDLLDRLRDEASAAGGRVVVLNGNHEVMNVLWDFRYVTPGGWRAFDGTPGLALDDPRVRELPESSRARAAAFVPGGPYATRMAARHIAAVVGDTAFAHAGILPQFVAGLRELDRGVQGLMRGDGEHVDDTIAAIMDSDSPVWTRRYGGDDPGVCVPLGEALAALGARRMVVGHTVQDGGITSACDGRLWRIDVGMAAHYGGRAAALEIRGDAVQTITQ
jgi:hypothetical protein